MDLARLEQSDEEDYEKQTYCGFSFLPHEYENIFSSDDEEEEEEDFFVHLVRLTTAYENAPFVLQI